jgi:hypothetical protein
MTFSIEQIDPAYLLWAGAAGVLLGLVLFFVYLAGRIGWVIRAVTDRKRDSFKPLSSLGKLCLLIIWTSLFGMVLCFGLFLRSYHAFTHEEPVAEISTHPIKGARGGQGTLIRLSDIRTGETRQFLIKGDQWMIEGDILKWDKWLNFLGLHTRYRLTRLRGRYMSTRAEIQGPRTLYPLVPDEAHPLWGFFYRYGRQLPLVSTAYGSAAYQMSDTEKRFLIYVGTSGFTVREAESGRSGYE